MIMIGVLSAMGGVYSLISMLVPVQAQFDIMAFRVFNFLSGITMLIGSLTLIIGFAWGRILLITGYIIALIWLILRIAVAPSMLYQAYLQIALIFVIWGAFSVYIGFSKNVRNYFNPKSTDKIP